VKTRLAAPRQDRSQRTLDRIVATAERMLEDGTFDEATVQQIVRQARSSIGSFYARFPDKDALLEHLVGRVHDAMLERAARLRLDRRWQAADLQARLVAYVDVVAGWTREHRGILRARLLHHLALGDAAPRAEVEKTRRLVRELRACFDPVVHQIRSPQPARALDDALQLIDAMVGTRYLLHGPGLQTFPVSGESAFRRNVVRAAASLLDDAGGRGR